MKQDDYVPRTNGLLGLTYAESLDYFMIDIHVPARFVLSPHVESDGVTTILVEVEGGTMKRSPYHGE